MLGAAFLSLFAAANDPYFTSVVSLNHWNGTAGQFDSPDQISFRTWNRFGSGTQLTTAQTKFSTTSLLIPGGGAAASQGPYLTTDPSFVLGTKNFTIEAWVWFSTNPQTGDAVLHDWRTGAGQDAVTWNDYFVAGTGGTFKYTPYLGGGAPTPTIQLSTGQWYHIAATRSGTTIRTFINGVTDITWTGFAADLNYGTPVPKIGTRYSGGGGGIATLYVDDYRVTVGVARYTADFTPPTEPFPNQ
jgi:hypothetical protein